MCEGGYLKQLGKHRSRGRERNFMRGLDLPPSPLGLKVTVLCLRKSEINPVSLEVRTQ